MLFLIAFQSPSNRVKCSDTSFETTENPTLVRFQSPSNRVKCSDWGTGTGDPNFPTGVSIP